MSGLSVPHAPSTSGPPALLPRSVRVYHLIKSLGRGGAETLLVQGARSAPEGVAQAFGFFLAWKDDLVPDLVAAGARVDCFSASGAAGMLRRAPEVARALVSWGADLVHCHLPMAGVVGRLAGRMAGVPVVYTEHNLQERYHWMTRFLLRRTWAWQSAVVAVSQEVRASALRSAGARVPVHVVRNGIPVDDLTRCEPSGRAVRERLGIPTGAPVVGAVAVMRSQKRLDLWLDVAHAVAAARPDAHFILVGDGPLRGELEARRRQRGLDEQVHFVGLQHDVRPFLSALDAYLLSSEFEGLPLALLEAMAAELPVVATAVGGVPEAVEDGRTGYLAARGEVAMLTRRLLELLGDEDQRRRFGQAARRVVVERFSTARMQRELRLVYEDALQTSATARRSGGVGRPCRS